MRRTEGAAAGVSREYNSYCGNCTYDGERLITRVDAASDPTRIGSDQVRGVRFEGERMVLIPPPRKTGETDERREITRGAHRGGVSRASPMHLPDTLWLANWRGKAGYFKYARCGFTGSEQERLSTARAFRYRRWRSASRGRYAPRRATQSGPGQ